MSAPLSRLHPVFEAILSKWAPPIIVPKLAPPIKVEPIWYPGTVGTHYAGKSLTGALLTEDFAERMKGLPK